MIISVQIKGFQSHVHSQFTLSPGLTVLTGPTDSGKTALIRAIRWVAFNEPAGETFVNQNTGEAIVTITLDDGTVITKGRKKGGRTVYHLAPANGKSQIFEQADVPQEVMAALGITRQTFGDFETALNFAFQLDAPFMISEPPSAGAKVLGKIAGTEIVDQALKSVAKDTYGARQDKLQADKRIEQLTEDLKAYNDVDRLKEQVEACDTLLQQFEQQRTQYETLFSLRSQKDTLDQQIHEFQETLWQFENLPVTEELLNKLDTDMQKLDVLSGFMQQYLQLNASIFNYTQELTLYVGLEQASEQLVAIDQLLVTADKLLDFEDRYSRILENLKKADAVLAVTQNLDVAATDLADVDLGMQRLNNLKVLSGQYQAYTATMAARQKLLEGLQGIEQAEPLLAGLDDQRMKLDRLRELQAIYRVKHSTFEEAGRKVTAAAAAVAAQETVVQDLWAEVDICPLCERPILEGDTEHGH